MPGPLPGIAGASPEGFVQSCPPDYPPAIAGGQISGFCYHYTMLFDFVNGFWLKEDNSLLRV
jgi:hypothetical protein